MKKQLFSLLLALAVLTGMLSGCGSNSSSSASVPSSAETPEETPTIAVAEEGSAEESTEEASETVPEEPAIVIEYPLTDEVETITYWTSYPGLYSNIAEDWNSTICFPVMEEKIGIKLSVTCVSFMAESEQYGLMIASGEFPDFLQTNYYTGGLLQAYNDDVVLDLTDLLDENAPNYVAYLDGLDAATQELLLEENKSLAVYTLYDDVYTTRGMVTRNDWLEELDLEAPATLDDFTDMLYAFKNAYDCDYTYRVSEDGGITWLNDAFNTYIVGADASDFPIYLEDGNIICTYTADTYRAYLEWFAQLYADGIVHPDFYTMDSMDQSSRYQAIVSGNIGVWEENAFSINDWQGYTDNADLLEAVALRNICDEDNVNNWGEIPVYANEQGFSITTTCENPELVLQFFNYFFTEEGSNLANYGVEGVTYTGIENGVPQWTDLIAANPDGFSADNALYAYSLNKSLVPYYSVQAKLWNCYADNAVAAAELWSDVSNTTTEHDVPYGAGLTANESNEISSIANDVMTYANEVILNFMTGAQPITDDTWNSYIAVLEDFGLQTVVDTYQNAYDEYVNGER